MNGKIRLITPPDIFENESKSILFVHLSEDDQENVSLWLSNSTINENLNIYYYDQEVDIRWLLFAVSKADAVFIDVDRLTEHTKLLFGYFLGKSNVSYKVEDNSVSALCHYINQDRIINIKDFLERYFNEQIRD